MYRIYYVNFSYYADQEFANLDEAIAYGKSVGFDFRVDRNGDIIASWGYFTGLRYWQR